MLWPFRSCHGQVMICPSAHHYDGNFFHPDKALASFSTQLELFSLQSISLWQGDTLKPSKHVSSYQKFPLDSIFIGDSCLAPSLLESLKMVIIFSSSTLSTPTGWYMAQIFMHLLAAWAPTFLKKKKSNIDYFNHDAYENFVFLWAHCFSTLTFVTAYTCLYRLLLYWWWGYMVQEQILKYPLLMVMQMICQCLIILYTDNKLCDIWKSFSNVERSDLGLTSNPAFVIRQLYAFKHVPWFLRFYQLFSKLQDETTY